VIPPIEAKTGAQLHVGGVNAVFEDFGEAISEKLPLFIGVVVLLLGALADDRLRSLLVPLKAVLMNLLSIGASFGIIVAVFQWGWGASLIGVDNTGPIISFFPIFLFAIVFGLSMDYEVFLMSRIHEEWEHKKDPTEAVTRGLALTGRVITAAAAIMVTVFASFMLGDERIIKLFGLGLASAVLIDAASSAPSSSPRSCSSWAAAPGTSPPGSTASSQGCRWSHPRITTWSLRLTDDAGRGRVGTLVPHRKPARYARSKCFRRGTSVPRRPALPRQAETRGPAGSIRSSNERRRDEVARRRKASGPSAASGIRWRAVLGGVRWPLLKHSKRAKRAGFRRGHRTPPRTAQRVTPPWSPCSP